MDDLEKARKKIIEKFDKGGVNYCDICLLAYQEFTKINGILICNDCLYINKIINKTKNIS